MRRLGLPAATALISFAATSSSASSVASSIGKPTTTTATQEDNDGAPASTAAEGINRYLKSGKATKNAKNTKNAKKDGGDGTNRKLLKCAQRLLGDHIYDGSCGNTFVATIGCRDEKNLEDCSYLEESLDGSTSQGVCIPFNMKEVLSIVDGNACQFGYNAGIHLQESTKPLDPSCEPEYTVRIAARIGKGSSDSPLHIFFSSDGGDTWYNEEDPRIATRVANEEELFSRRAQKAAPRGNGCPKNNNRPTMSDDGTDGGTDDGTDYGHGWERHEWKPLQPTCYKDAHLYNIRKCRNSYEEAHRLAMCIESEASKYIGFDVTPNWDWRQGLHPSVYCKIRFCGVQGRYTKSGPNPEYDDYTWCEMQMNSIMCDCEREQELLSNCIDEKVNNDEVEDIDAKVLTFVNPWFGCIMSDDLIPSHMADD